MKKLRSVGTIPSLNPSGSVNVLAQITDAIRTVQDDILNICDEFNSEVHPLLSSLPRGRHETRWSLTDAIHAKRNGLDGRGILVDTASSSISDGGRFWYTAPSGHGRPLTIREALLNLHSLLATTIDGLRREIRDLGAVPPRPAYNFSPTPGNLVDRDVRAIVFDGGTVQATSIAPGTIRVSSPALLEAGQGPRIVVGNAPAGDSHAVCQYLDIGDGAELIEALADAQAQNPPGDVWIRPGIYDLSSYTPEGQPAGELVLGPGVRVRGAGRENTIIRTGTMGFRTGFRLQERSFLSEVTIEVPLPTGPSSPARRGIIILEESGAECLHVNVEFLDKALYEIEHAEWLNIWAAFCVEENVENTRFVECQAGIKESMPHISFFGLSDLCGFLVSGPGPEFASTLIGCKTRGGDYGYFSERSVKILECASALPLLSGYVLFGVDYAEIGESWASKMAIGPLDVGIFLLNSNSCLVRNNIVSIEGGGGDAAIYLWGSSYNIITANRAIAFWTNGAELGPGSDHNILTTNYLGPILDVGINNDLAHNR